MPRHSRLDELASVIFVTTDKKQWPEAYAPSDRCRSLTRGRSVLPALQ